MDRQDRLVELARLWRLFDSDLSLRDDPDDGLRTQRSRADLGDDAARVHRPVMVEAEVRARDLDRGA